VLGAICLLATLVWAGAASAAQGSGAVSRSLLGGVNIGSVSRSSSPAEAERTMEVAHQLHAKLVRLELPWALVQPSAPDRMEAQPLNYVDRLAAAATADGIRLIMLVENTPCWASSAPALLLGRCVAGSGAASAWPPKDPATYAAFVAFLAQRYGPALAALEIWNEPDQSNEQYFAGPEKPQRYAAVLRAAYTAIKRANPSVTVLGGSLVGSNGVFLRALYAAGIKGYYDGLSVHFYNLTLASLRSIHEVQLANGDRTPLWLDEFGWSSCWPAHKIQQEQACVTAQIQAQNLTNTFRALSRVPYMAAAVVYKLRDSGAEDFGALSMTGAHKPSFSALSHVFASPFGSPSPVSMKLRRQGGRVVASGSGPVGDFMAIEAFQGTLLRYRAFFTLDRFNRFSIPLPSVLGTSGLRVRVYQYWSGVARAAQASI